MNQPRKPKKVKAPDGIVSDYLTIGKEYDVLDSDGTILFIKSDDGHDVHTLIQGSSHLDFKDWIVTEYEDEN